MRSASASPSRSKFAWRAVFGGRQNGPRKVYDNCESDRGQSFKHLR